MSVEDEVCEIQNLISNIDMLGASKEEFNLIWHIKIEIAQALNEYTYECSKRKAWRNNEPILL